MNKCKHPGCDKEPIAARHRCEYHRDAQRLKQARKWAKVYREAAGIRANERTREATNQNKVTLTEVQDILKQPAVSYTTSTLQHAPPEKFARMVNRLLA